MKSPLPENEQQRLEALYSYDILDSEPEAVFDGIVALAAKICGVRYALINLVDRERQWFKATYGFNKELKEVPRHVGICSHTLLQQGILEIPDTLQDERTSANPLVTGSPWFRFYAGIALRTPDGLPIGTLCVLDRKTRELDTWQKSSLRQLSRVIADLFEKRKLEKNRLEAASILDAITDAFVSYDNQWRITYFNSAAEMLSGRRRHELLGKSTWAEFPESVDTVLYQELHRAKAENVPAQFEFFYPPLDAWLEARAYPFANGVSVYYHDTTARKKAEARLQESERQFRDTFEHAATGVAHVSLEGRWLRFNRQLMDFLGYSADELKSLTFADITHPDDVEANIAETRRLMAGEVQSYAIEKRYIRKDGTVVWGDLTVSLIRDGEGRPRYFVSVIADATRRKAAEMEMRNSEQRFRATFEQSALGMAHVTGESRVLRVNRKLCEIFGYSAQELQGMDLKLLSHPEDMEAASPHAARLRSGEADSIEFEKRYLRKNGDTLWAHVTGSLVREATGAYFAMSLEDITLRKKMEQQLTQMAHYDQLTGVANRNLFYEHLDKALRRARRHRKHVALLYMDLDKFKEINDTHGHHAGDVLLKDFAQRLTGCVRSTDVVARLGGDEFAVILEDVEIPEGAIGVAQKIIDAMRTATQFEGHALQIGTSIGIALDAAGLDIEGLLKRADEAMYRAKQAGRGRICLARGDE
jgi:diguanylate cyclase (GGDEF)-like protein/PAS domain S-box-containing protein